MTRQRSNIGAGQNGLSYAETLLAVVVLAVALVPAVETLDTAFTGAQVSETIIQWQQALATRMEDMRAEPFGDLDAAATAAGSETVPSSYSDPGGGTDRVLVFLARYDGDNADADNNPFTGADPGLLWLRVAVENTPYELVTLVAQ